MCESSPALCGENQTLGTLSTILRFSVHKISLTTRRHFCTAVFFFHAAMDYDRGPRYFFAMS